MTTDLRERLHELADDAPRGGVAGDDVWRRGVRRHRLRQAGAVVAAAAAVVAVLGVAVVLPPSPTPPPAGDPAVRGIPELVEPPDPWSEPTRTPGPLAAISIGHQNTVDGLTGTGGGLRYFGVSAVDGVARFLDLPTRPQGLDPGSAALSPDGTTVALTRFVPRERGGSSVVGWDLLDTTTGDVRELRVSGQDVLSGTDAYEISFSGDGRHLLTNYSLSGSDDSHADSLVVWDVETGEPVEAEGPGHYWLPGPATHPGLVAWNRQNSVWTFDVATGERRQVRLPGEVLEASWSPDGRTLVYLGPRSDARGAPWRLFHLIGSTTGRPVTRALDVGLAPGQVLGWVDDTHAVVSRYGPRGARVVDVTTGDWERLRLEQDVDALMVPRYATDLLAQPVAEAVAQPDARDPRWWMDGWARVALAALLGLGVALVVRRWRDRA